MPNLDQLFKHLNQSRVNLSWCYLWKAPASRLEKAANALSEREIIEALPNERKLAAEQIIARMLIISRQTLNQLATVYNDLAERSTVTMKI